jgi:Flp pilus assembly protein TadD
LIPGEGDEKTKAFALHGEGWFQDSLLLCTRILERDKDPSIEILTATNLFFLKRYDDAEMYFRDLSRKMPDSSYVHSYLARVLDAKGDDGARAEYAAAVRLDPANQDALRSYAGHLLATGDLRGAIPVLRRLVALSKKKDDATLLVHALVSAGEAEEAIRAHAASFGTGTVTAEYLDALIAAGQAKQAASAASSLLREKHTPEILRRHLRAVALDNPGSARAEYARAAEQSSDPAVIADQVAFLMAQGHFEDARVACKKLLEMDRSSGKRLTECEILDRTGDAEAALLCYEQLLQEELETKNDPGALGTIIERFRAFLKIRYPDQVKARLISRIASDVNAISLAAAGQYFEEAGNAGEARSYYYRAFRCDFLNGGLEYARFLSRSRDLRETEKTLLYIVANARKIPDLERVARTVATGIPAVPRMKRLLAGLISALERRRDALRYEGTEILAQLYLRAAKGALERGDTLSCKEYCLRGIDTIPPGSRAIRLEDFTVLLRVCKDRVLIDIPVLPSAERPSAPGGVPLREETAHEDLESLAGEFGLDDKEKAAVAFLRAHRQTNEMELRTVLATRRVVGIMNRLIQKMQRKGKILIEKRGVGDQGEMYEYVGN